MFSFQKHTEKLASEVPKQKTEISFKVRVWGYCPSLQADSGLGLSNAVKLLCYYQDAGAFVSAGITSVAVSSAR